MNTTTRPAANDARDERLQVDADREAAEQGFILSHDGKRVEYMPIGTPGWRPVIIRERRAA